MAEFEDEVWLREDKPLNEDELAEFGEALGDAFLAKGLAAKATVTVMKDVVYEPFWGSELRADSIGMQFFSDFRERMRKEGRSDAEILDQYLLGIEEGRFKDAPDWYQSNPFHFDIERLDRFFTARCINSLGGLSEGLRVNGGSLGFRELIPAVRPYTKAWFELHICEELALLRGDTAGEVEKISRAGIVGRQIQEYRWRFGYGADAARGRKTKVAAQRGGESLAKIKSSMTQEILAVMSNHVSNGHSVRRASELASARGFGASPSANRKLWYRHRKMRTLPAKVPR